MSKIIDSTNLGYLISKMKAAFWPKSDVVQIGLDATPVANSDNLVKSGGVKSYVDASINMPVSTSQPAGGFEPNILYNLGTLTGSKTFSLATPSDNTIVNHYYWTFTAGSTAPTITWPSGLTWVGTSAPAIEAGGYYEISVLNGIAAYLEA